MASFCLRLIGLVAGGGAIVFQFLGQFIQQLRSRRSPAIARRKRRGSTSISTQLSDFSPPGSLWPSWPLADLISGWLVYTFAPEAEGHGTDAAIDSFHNRRGEIRTRIPIIKTLASAVTLGTGGSAGREGPIAQIGAGFGSILATRLKLSSRDRRIMLAAGIGAGVGAIFRAPLAGALFAGEILYRDVDLESDVIVPSAVSSTVAYSVYCLSLPAEMRFTPLFGRGLQFSLGSPLELLPFAALAIVLALAGILYVMTFSSTQTTLWPVADHPTFTTGGWRRAGRARRRGPLLRLQRRPRRPGGPRHRLWNTAKGPHCRGVVVNQCPARHRILQNRDDVSLDRFRRIRWRFRALDGDRWLPRGGRWQALPRLVARGGYSAAGLRDRRDGRVLCRRRAGPIFDHSDGFRDDRRLQAAAADHVGRHDLLSAQPTLDDSTTNRYLHDSIHQPTEGISSSMSSRESASRMSTKKTARCGWCPRELHSTTSSTRWP